MPPLVRELAFTRSVVDIQIDRAGSADKFTSIVYDSHLLITAVNALYSRLNRVLMATYINVLHSHTSSYTACFIIITYYNMFVDSCFSILIPELSNVDLHTVSIHQY